MELTKANYKQTEIGFIPEEWTLERIADFAFITTGGSDTQDKVNDGAYPFYVRSNQIERINKYSFDGEAILTSGDGVGVGKVFHYVTGKFDFHQRVYNIYGFRDNVDGKYLFFQFSTNFFDRVMSMTAKSSVDSVRREMIADMLIPIPPTLTEQKAIATALSDVDSLISSLDKLITKKKAIKQGAMQELLTPPHKGGRRLPGFSGDWVEIELKEKYTFLNGKPYENKLDRSGEYFLITLDSVNIEGNLKANHKRVDFYDNSLIKGDLVTVLSDIAHAKLLGLSGYITENKKYVLNQRMGRLRFDSDIDPQFARYQINYHQEYFKNRGQGSSQRHIYKKDFDEFILKYPKKNEQQQIVEILNDLQDEINTLICKKSKFLDLKQGMMQELLTGKTRLI